MGNQIDESKGLSETRIMNGRRIIKSSVSEITDQNVTEVLWKALGVHELNRSEIDYLYKYYKGDQPIRHRVKDVRPEICNKIVENRANEIVSFKVGYLCGEPIQYVSRNGDDTIVKQVNLLNEYMFAEDKAAQDPCAIDDNFRLLIGSSELGRNASDTAFLLNLILHLLGNTPTSRITLKTAHFNLIS